MMRLNKSGNVNLLLIFFVIMVFSLVSVSAVIITYFYYVVGWDYIALPLYNASTTFNTSAVVTAGFESTAGSYRDMDLTFIDQMWAFGYFVLLITSFMIAYKARPMNNFAWLSYLTYGLMIVLYVAGLFAVILSWLYNDILLNLFTNLAINAPFLEYFVTNFGFVFLIHATGLLLVNKVDLDLASILQRRKKEENVFGDDEVL